MNHEYTHYLDGRFDMYRRLQGPGRPRRP
ncbi:collagenase [Kitasatospora albolonga]